MILLRCVNVFAVLACLEVKAKFYYTIADSEMVRSWFEAKFHYAIWFEPALNQLRTSKRNGIWL